MKIYEYRKHYKNEQIVDPEFITNGNQWYSPINDSYIAVLPDTLPYYIPDTLTVLTVEQLITRVQDINKIKPFAKRTGIMGSGGTEDPTQTMTDQDVADMINEWILNQF